MIHACDVAIVTAREVCGDVPAFPYWAWCPDGHHVSGYACEACMAARVLGCGECHARGRGSVKVTFEPGTCHCGCGADTALADRSDSRYGRVRGRPKRYIASHNPRPLEVGANGR